MSFGSVEAVVWSKKTIENILSFQKVASEGDPLNCGAKALGMS